MLNHHTQRLTLRLMILFLMVAALLWPSPSSAERKALTSTPNQQVVPVSAPNLGSHWECFYTFDPDTGQCAYVCCSGSYCVVDGC